MEPGVDLVDVLFLLLPPLFPFAVAGVAVGVFDEVLPSFLLLENKVGV